MRSLAWMYFGSTLAGAALWALGWFVVSELATCHAQTVEVHATPTPRVVDWSVYNAGWGKLTMPGAKGRWEQPERPEEVVCEVQTKDGQWWVAKWMPKP